MWGSCFFFTADGRDCETRVRSVRPQEGKCKRRLIGRSNACRFAAVPPHLYPAAVRTRTHRVRCASIFFVFLLTTISLADIITISEDDITAAE